MIGKQRSSSTASVKLRVLRKDWTAPENRSAHKGLLPTNEIVSHKKTFAFSPPPLPNRRARRDNEPTSHKSTSLSIYIRKLGRRRKKRCTCTEATFGQRKCFGNLLLSNNADPIKPLTRNEAPLTIKKKNRNAAVCIEHGTVNRKFPSSRYIRRRVSSENVSVSFPRVPFVSAVQSRNDVVQFIRPSSYYF